MTAAQEDDRSRGRGGSEREGENTGRGEGKDDEERTTLDRETWTRGRQGGRMSA